MFIGLTTIRFFLDFIAVIIIFFVGLKVWFIGHKLGSRGAGWKIIAVALFLGIGVKALTFVNPWLVDPTGFIENLLAPGMLIVVSLLLLKGFRDLDFSVARGNRDLKSRNTSREGIKNIRIISAILVLAGLAVVLGWAANIDFLKGIEPWFPTMKMSTAVSFVATGIVLYLFSIMRNTSKIMKIFVAVISIAMLLFMIFTFSGAFFDYPVGFEKSIYGLQPDSSGGIFVGKPSMGAQLGFGIISLASLFIIFNARNARRFLGFSVGLLILIGAIAIIGYTLNIPQMYYMFYGYSNGMAICTAILMILTGIGFSILKDLMFAKYGGKK